MGFFAVDNFIHKTNRIVSNFQKHLIFSILQHISAVLIVDIFLKIVDNVDIVVNIPTLLFNESAILLWITG